MALDCWGLVREVMRRYGHEVPEFDISCYDALSITAAMSTELAGGHWTRIDEPEPGCGVAMAIDSERPGVVQHFGVYVGADTVIHTLSGVGSCTFSLGTGLWQHLIKGYYRWTG